MKLSQRLAGADRRDAEIHTTGRTESTPGSGRPAEAAVTEESDRDQVQDGDGERRELPETLPGNHDAGHEERGLQTQCVPAQRAVRKAGPGGGGSEYDSCHHHGQRQLAHEDPRARPQGIAVSIRSADQPLSKQRCRAPFPLLQFYTFCHANLTQIEVLLFLLPGSEEFAP